MARITRSRVWSFLNSGFGLFLLSSVLLGSLSFLHTAWTKATERRYQVEQLDLEIALRIRDMQALARGPESNRYSTLTKIDRIGKGDTSKFYLRRPLFQAFESRPLSDLLWQLYLLVPRRNRPEIKVAIQHAVGVSDCIASFRYRAASALPDRPEGKIPEEESRLAEQEDVLTADYGQMAAYRHVAQLAGIRRWRSLQ